MDVKREAVLRTAAHLFLEYGYQKSSMSMLASQLKITKPALYYYFSNKEEITGPMLPSGNRVDRGTSQRNERKPGDRIAKALHVCGDLRRCACIVRIWAMRTDAQLT